MSDEPTDEANRTTRARRAFVTNDEPRDAVLDALWSRVMDAWDDDKPHHALLEYAITQQKLPDIAGRYRSVKESDAEKGPRAQKKLDGIVVAATHMLMAMKTAPAPTKVPTMITLTAFVICVVLIGWVAHLVFRRG